MYRFDPPALVEFTPDLKPGREIPFSIPPHCALFNLFSAPVGGSLAVELSCPNGQTVLFFDTETEAASQPVHDSDSHFLAWRSDGEAAYLKVDSLGSPRVVRASIDGQMVELPVSEFTYDIGSANNPQEFTFTVSSGLGQGSKISLAERTGRTSRLLYDDPHHYLSFARFSPIGP